MVSGRQFAAVVRSMGLAASVCFALAACETIEGTVTLGTIGATLLGAQAPTQEIEQIYYVGVFDPQEQLPPEVYRIRVHGQASFISLMKFGSGWVRADLIDSLGTTVGFNEETNAIEVKKSGDDDVFDNLKTGRRLVMFGPEGFREAPADHRLVIVMGSSPENFFKAIDQSLSVVSEVREERRNAALDRALFEALTRLRSERQRLAELAKDIDADLPMPKEAAQ